MNISGETIVMIFTGLAGLLTAYKTGGAILKARKIRIDAEFAEKVGSITTEKLIKYHEIEKKERNRRVGRYEAQFGEHEEEVARLITKLADNEARENAIELAVNDLSNKIQNLKERFDDRLKL